MRFFLHLFGTAIVLAAALVGTASEMGSAIKPLAETLPLEMVAVEMVPDPISPPPPVKVTLGFVGDIMLDRGVAKSVEKNFNSDFGALFTNLSFLKEFDVLFGNLEGPISARGQKVGSKWSFRMKPEVARVLAEAGFDVLSVANNHIGDFTKVALVDTLEYLRKENIAASGASAEPAIIEKNGLKIGFLAFSDVGPAWLRSKILLVDKNYQEIIREASKKVDMLIVSFHWGEEYKTRSNNRQKQIGRGAIDAGAKIVIGHHPHVIQEIEKYKGGLIAYSLGNFIFDQYFSEKTMRGKLLALVVGKNPFTQKSEIQEIKEKLVKLNKFFQPAEIIDTKDYVEDIKPIKISETGCPTGTSDKDLLLFNISAKNALDNYVPNDLKSVDSVCLREETALAFESMQQAAKKHRINFSITSGFRDHISQKDLYKNWQVANTAATFAAVALPGHSEHQLGTAVDLSSPSINNLSGSDLFASTPAYAWLLERAVDFGFVLSYPAGKEAVTGYKFEPWHWRYVGKEFALKIKMSNQTPSEAL